MSHAAATYRALIHLHFFVPKVGHLLEGVDGDEHRADVRLGWFYVKDQNVKKESKRDQCVTEGV